MTREEAIKRIKAWNLDSDDMEVLSAAIPEFTESKDWIIGIVNSCKELSFKDKVKLTRYLEKQKEQKPPIAGNDFGWIDELKHDLEHPEELDQKVDDVLKQRNGTRALEWSEEDREMKLKILKYLSTRCSVNEFEEVENWLNNLRPSWKPSEEQIGALDYACCELFKRKDVEHNILSSLQKLCDELKKLGVKEEPKYYQHFDPDC